MVATLLPIVEILVPVLVLRSLSFEQCCTASLVGMSLLVGKSSDTNAAIGLLPVVGDFDDVTTVLLFDGSVVATSLLQW